MSNTKKEIDKELMYKKLMPTGPKNNNFQFEGVSEPTPTQTNTERFIQETSNVQHRAMNRREIGIPVLDTQQTILVNTVENVVLEKLDSVLTRFQCCKCDRCKKDIVALTLNKLSPKYMVLLEGQAVPEASTQENAQIISAMIQSIIAVRNHTRH